MDTHVTVGCVALNEQLVLHKTHEKLGLKSFLLARRHCVLFAEMAYSQKRPQEPGSKAGCSYGAEQGPGGSEKVLRAEPRVCALEKQSRFVRLHPQDGMRGVTAPHCHHCSTDRQEDTAAKAPSHPPNTFLPPPKD